MIEFQDVCYAYETEPILRHVNFTIPEGAAVLLSGPNGCGKSTLLRILNGLLFPQQGTYLFEGTAITAARMQDHRWSKAYHQRVGFVWQNPDVQLFCASVEAELAFGPQQMGLSEAAVKERVAEALDLFSLTHLRNRAPYYLSGGEKKRAAFASIFTMNPEVWTMDEPLAALDEKTQRWLMDFLAALKKAGKTLIFSSHEQDLAQHLADREIRLDETHQGRLRINEPR